MTAAVRNQLKAKIVSEYAELIRCWEKGYKANYEYILEELSIWQFTQDNVDSPFDNCVQFYLNTTFWT